MIQSLRVAFGVDNNSACLSETTAVCIEVFDCYDCIPAEQRSYIRTKDEEPVHFTLNNPKAENICFAAVDNCLLGSRDPAKCDFIIGNEQKFYFVEIKNTIINKRRAARASALTQLDSSIGHLRKSINLIDTELIAVICLKAKQVYPLQTATRSAEVVKFKLTHNATLMEGQSAIF